MQIQLSSKQIYGLDDSVIDYESLSVPVHREIVKSFLDLQQQASQRGFSLSIASGYRSFERQLHIWNQKAEGKRPVYDSLGKRIDLSALNDWERVQSILRWSALPGLSRHHWGTDIDVYDSAAVPPDYQVQLSPQEVADSGPFGPMHCWLDTCLAATENSVFFRPYNVDAGGVAPERWHLSFLPQAEFYEEQVSVEGLERALMNQPICLKDVVLANLEEIVGRFFRINCSSR